MLELRNPPQSEYKEDNRDKTEQEYEVTCLRCGTIARTLGSLLPKSWRGRANVLTGQKAYFCSTAHRNEFYRGSHSPN
jgi:hypothetical protein